MITLVVIFSLMLIFLIGSLSFVILKPGKFRTIPTNSLNIKLCKQELKEITNQHKNKQITEDTFATLKSQIEQKLVVDLQKDKINNNYTKIRKKLFISLITIFILVSSIFIYAKQGNINVDIKSSTQAPDINKMMTGLVKRLKQNPQDYEGWMMLGRSLMHLNRYEEAVTTYKRAQQIFGDKVDILVSQADALAMANDGKIDDEIFSLLQKSLKIEPQHRTALYLISLGYMEREDYTNALKNWQILLPLIKDDEETTTQIKNIIKEVQKKLNK
jgi:cytochrome c-type biogenesis protein CcmH